MKKELVSFDAPELSVIEKSKAKQIKATFEPMVKMLEEFEEVYNGIMSESKNGITKELCSKAKRARLNIAKIRISTDKVRLAENEESQREIKARNGVASLVTWAVSDREAKLKELENHFEIIEKKRLDDLQKSRVEELSKYVEDAHERSLSSMEDDVWQAYLSTKKKEHEDRIEAEKQAELQRIETVRLDEIEAVRRNELYPYAMFVNENNTSLREMTDKEYSELLDSLVKAKKDYEDEQEMIKQENERLKKEAEAKEKALEKERKKAKEDAERLKAENEAKLRKEKEDREKLEAELKAKKEAEEKALKEAEAKRQAELSKGDSDKLKDLLNDLEGLKTKYSFKSDKNKKMYSDVSILIDKVIAHIKK